MKMSRMCIDNFRKQEQCCMLMTSEAETVPSFSDCQHTQTDSSVILLR